MDPDSPSPGPGRLACLAAFFVVLGVFLVSRQVAAGTLYFPFVNEPSGVQLHFALQLANHELWKEGLPLWDPWSGCGTPQLATYQSWVFFPLSALYLVLPPVQASELLLVARLAILGLGCMALARSIGISRGAGLFLALAFTFNEVIQRYAGNSILNTDLLLPWTTLAYLRLGRTGRLGPCLAATALTALNLVGGLPEATFFAIGFASITFLYAAFLGRGRDAWKGLWRKLGVLFGVLAGGTALAAIQVLPFLEYLGNAWSPHLVENTYSWNSQSLGELPALAYPYLPGMSELPPPPLPLGVVVLLFFARGLRRSSNRGLALFMAGFALIATLKVFGIQPVHSIGELPVFNTLAFPLYLGSPLRLAVTLVAALGFDDWWRTARDRAGHGPWLVTTLFLLLLWWEGNGSSDGAWAAYPMILLGLTFSALALLFLRARLAAPRAGPLLFAVGALLAGELWLHHSRIEWDASLYEKVYRPALEGRDDGIVALLPDADDPSRRYSVQGNVAPNIQLLWGPSLGFEYQNALKVERYHDYWAETNRLWFPAESEKALRLLRIAAVDTLVLRGDGHKPDETTDLMHWLSSNRAVRWTGSGAPVFEQRGGERRVHAESPFELRLPRIDLSSFDAVAFRFRVEGQRDRPLVVQLLLPRRAGSGVLGSWTVQPGDDEWHDSRAGLPDGIGSTGLRLVASGPTEPGPRVVLAELRLLRELHLPAERLVPGPEAPPYRVFGIEGALPRAYVVHAARVARRSAVLELLDDPSFQPGREVVLEEPCPLPLPEVAAPSSRARIVASHAKRVVVEVDAERDGLLVLSDTYYPGWVARVDGERRRILPANLMFRAVPVEAGQHTVEFLYRPLSVRLGAAISLLSLLSLIGLATLGALAARRQTHATIEPARSR